MDFLKSLFKKIIPRNKRENEVPEAEESNKAEVLEYVIKTSVYFDTAVAEMIDIANSNQVRVRATFNGVTFEVIPGDTAEVVRVRYEIVKQREERIAAAEERRNVQKILLTFKRCTDLGQIQEGNFTYPRILLWIAEVYRSNFAEIDVSEVTSLFANYGYYPADIEIEGDITGDSNFDYETNQIIQRFLHDLQNQEQNENVYNRIEDLVHSFQERFAGINPVAPRYGNEHLKSLVSKYYRKLNIHTSDLTTDNFRESYEGDNRRELLLFM
jgi:hypothetical protein